MIYRSEHPKPQFRRDSWLNLNGQWDFEIDHGNSGAARGMANPGAEFTRQINVPFCPESKLSGVEYKDFMISVWYRRTVDLTQAQLKNSVRLHFGAVDYQATVYINGTLAGTHKGGYVSFFLDITQFLHPGENTITLHAEDDTRNPMIPHGKQCDQYFSYACSYTRTTGIWQTVWLEFLPQTHIESMRFYPNADQASLTVTADLRGAGDLTVRAQWEGRDMGSLHLACQGGHTVFTLPLVEKHLWELGKGGLYDLTLCYEEDLVHSYFGLRDIQYADYRFLLNGRSVFQRLILDQGFYPDGVYTAPSDQELEADIDRSMAMGFNGARLHEKVFEERFLYHCDRKGYLVWGEYPNWGLSVSRPESVFAILPEWLEVINRDFNHPAIVGWCPFNETRDANWGSSGTWQCDDVLSTVYRATKAADQTRPCIDTSGYFHVETDIYDLHDYEQNPETFRNYYCDFDKDFTLRTPMTLEPHQHYDNRLPFFISEYGGIQWSQDASGWGYGDAPKTEEEFLARLKGLTDVLLDCRRMFAFCYTQLTDVEQEQNGLYTYQRVPKFDPELIREIIERKAAIED